ncbi:biliverdin-producing heme oxygenase [Paraburkholderia sp. MMS20-SJTR3]|uniref:Biliverdin-producing heme oxygenase n=1 Tax=Paraburkholderia sejongensis TaxID=2886946 RepID=A0ABS8K012_9BURK|nr:biliverdin-producing heme oxygenase [Paraburkholderia sp. MMS20-SJTR3]
MATADPTARSPGRQEETPAVLAALRNATAQRHELLHELMPLSVHSVALRDYVAHLAVLRNWLAPLQAWLATFGDGPQSLHPATYVDRLALIDADLSHESVQPDDLAGLRAASTHCGDQSAAWPQAQNAAYRWGICYVIEGSQLGGAVLYARLRERLAPHPLCFLDAGRDALAARWRAFIRALAADVHTPTAIDDACRGAAHAFDRLIELAREAAGTASPRGVSLEHQAR